MEPELRKFGLIAGGLSLTFIGLLLLLSNFGIINVDWAKLWPLPLVIIGIAFTVAGLVYEG